MVRVASLAVAAGVVTGVWAVLALYLGALDPQCFGVACSPDALLTLITTVTSALSVVLIVDSIVCLIAPRKAFYASALLAALVAALFGYGGLYSGTLVDLGVIVALGLAVTTVVLSIAAARSGGTVSEQSNPMNLPVFG